MELDGSQQLKEKFMPFLLFEIAYPLLVLVLLRLSIKF